MYTNFLSLFQGMLHCYLGMLKRAWVHGGLATLGRSKDDLVTMLGQNGGGLCNLFGIPSGLPASVAKLIMRCEDEEDFLAVGCHFIYFFWIGIDVVTRRGEKSWFAVGLMKCENWGVGKSRRFL